MNYRDRLAATMSDGPLDDTRLQQSIAGLGINAELRADTFHYELKQRVTERLAAPRWYHLDGTLCVAGWDPTTGLCAEGGGPVTPCATITDYAKQRIGHGLSRYSNNGCRCDTCKDAWRLYNARRRAQRRSKWNGTHPEGRAYSAATYTNWGCRCTDCKAAWAQARRSLRSEAKANDQ